MHLLESGFPANNYLSFLFKKIHSEIIISENCGRKILYFISDTLKYVLLYCITKNKNPNIEFLLAKRH